MEAPGAVPGVTNGENFADRIKIIRRGEGQVILHPVSHGESKFISITY
jgi:hypothetical protein